MQDTPAPSFDPRLLPAFVAVADERHFARAATRLNVAQPALSQQIRRLETQLGVQLFLRDARRVELTDAGEALLEEARTAVEAARRGARAVQATQHRAGTVLRLAADYDVPRRILSHVNDRVRASSAPHAPGRGAGRPP